MTGPELARALGFLRALARARATDVVAVPGGEVVLHRELPLAHDHNRVLVSRPCSARELDVEVERVFRSAGLEHRLVEVHDPDGLPDGLPGYDTGRELVMVFGGKAADPGAVDTLDVAERAAVATAGWRAEQPDWGDDVLDQLGRRVHTVVSAADATFLAVRDPAGRVVARADLYVRDGVAQVEDVNTDVAVRGQGLASRLVLEAVRRGQAAGADLVFLVADADDWPQQLYRRLGFRDAGTYAVLTADRPLLGQRL